MNVSHVPVDLIPGVWAELLPMVERGLRHGLGDCTTANHMLADLLSGKWQLWVIHEGDEIVAGLVIAVKQYAAKKAVIVELAAGRGLDEWIEQIEKILVDFRELVGADTIECACRAGLARRLDKRGWHRKSVIMELK